MKVAFNINYHTLWGQTLYIVGSIPELGLWNVSMAKPMQYTHDDNWLAEIDIASETKELEYRYILVSNNIRFFEEWEKTHKVTFDSSDHSYIIFDSWYGRPKQMAFYSSAFTKSFFAREEKEKTKKSPVYDKSILIKVFAPRVEKNQYLAIVGNQPSLGNWDVKKSLPLSCENFPEWEIRLDASKFIYPVEYKLILCNDDFSFVYWEPGNNRRFHFPLPKKKETVVFSDTTFREELSPWRCAGIVFPVFSLRSGDSFGIGDLDDLKKIVDWIYLSGQKIIQVLPINDTTMTHTWLDSYPYNAISIYALHPLYLSLNKLGKIKNKELAEKLEAKQQELNALEKVDYEQVDQYKWEYFREIFQQEGKAVFKTKAYIDFFRENEEWLIPYAAYSYLREKNKTADFKQWGEYAVYDRQLICKLCNQENSEYPDISIYYYIQFNLYLQLKEVKEYAHEHGIILKGDIPIGISETSVEAWTEPEYFNMNDQAGAPPDDFSAIGQNWGFPTYNWDTMENDGFSWWKKRFLNMAHFFDAYRIDHILGFFRIWEIPKSSVQGLYAYFNPALPFGITEIEKAGMVFNKQRFTTPHINESFLPELFGEYTQEVKFFYLTRSSSRHFALNPDYDSQIKIKNHFAGKEDDKSNKIREGLYTITNEVLFIPDSKDENKYHPRISASHSYIYQELNIQDKNAFDYLYWDYFYRRHNNFWKEQAYKRLTPLISCTDMMVCGEDLGMIPDSVPEVMDVLQILSLEIERMPKKPHMEFAHLTEIPYRSVCTTSTHDMSTIRGWWKEDKAKIQRYYNHVLERWGEAPDECTTEICEQIIMNHLNSPAMLVIIPIQDWLSVDGKLRRNPCESERINIPANSRHYWSYRIHLNIEQLLEEKDFSEKIKQMIKTSGRG